MDKKYEKQIKKKELSEKEKFYKLLRNIIEVVIAIYIFGFILSLILLFAG